MFFILMIAINISFVIINKWPGIEWLFLGLFLIEILLKIYTYGFIGFVSDYWNV